MRYVKTITGHISPKSVVSSGRGLVFAQNMMYTHTVTVYNSRTRRLVKTISDAVNLGRYGVKGHAGVSRGAPVELAFTPNGKYAYVSNYSMYGNGFGGEGTDTCYPGQYGPSFLYRIAIDKLKIDDAIEVGAVPKYVAITRDGRFVLVSNWCGYDLSIVSTRLGRQVKRISLGPYPRGIAVTPNGKSAYIAVMGTTNIAHLNLQTWKVSWLYGVGSGPRHLVVSPKGRVAVRHAERRGDGRQDRPAPRRGGAQGLDRGRAPLDGDLPGREGALRRELLLQHGEQGADGGHARAPERVGRTRARSASPTTRRPIRSGSRATRGRSRSSRTADVRGRDLGGRRAAEERERELQLGA